MLDVVLNNVSNEVSLSAFIINWKKHFFNKKKFPRKYDDLYLCLKQQIPENFSVDSESFEMWKQLSNFG